MQRCAWLALHARKASRMIFVACACPGATPLALMTSKVGSISRDSLHSGPASRWQGDAS